MSDQREIDNHFLKFRNDINRIMSKRGEYQTFRKYFDYVIEFKTNEIRAKALGIANQDEDDQKENMNEDISDLVNKFNSTKAVAKAKKEYLKKVYMYEIANLIRAHSKDSNINDNAVQVNDVAFELAPGHIWGRLDCFPNFTNLFATCGHNIVNIIDSESGKIVKRFNDDMLANRTKEVFV